MLQIQPSELEAVAPPYLLPDTLNTENADHPASRTNYRRLEYNGFEADLLGYALTEDNSLAYLSLVKRDRQSVTAILAGLVKDPPDQVLLTDQSRTHRQYAQAISKQQAGTRKLLVTSLKATKGYHGVLIPASALVEKDTSPHSGQSEFLIILPEEITSVSAAPISVIYLNRLNHFSELPLLSGWHQWLWQWVQEEGIVEVIKDSYYCQAVSCQLPQEARLGSSISEAIKDGLLRE